MPKPESDLPVVGFDGAGAGDDMVIVVAHLRPDGSLLVHVDPPPPTSTPDLAARWTRELRPAAAVPLVEQVERWMAEYAAGPGFTLTDEQRAVLAHVYGDLIRDRRLTYPPHGFTLNGRQVAAALNAPLPDEPR